jgi:hypothetical protein|nr:MAG TPA: hypothetical protein [Caudoviricetes sp.]
MMKIGEDIKGQLIKMTLKAIEETHKGLIWEILNYMSEKARLGEHVCHRIFEKEEYTTAKKSPIFSRKKAFVCL